jgi:hypothetical protein
MAAIEVLVQLGETRAEAELLVDRCLSRTEASKRGTLSTDEIVSQVFARRGG